MTAATTTNAAPAQWAGILLALGGPALIVLSAHSAPIQDPLVERAVIWVGFSVLSAVLLFGPGRSRLSDVGLGRPSWSSLGWGLLLTVAFFAVGAASYAAIRALGLPLPTAAFASLAALPFWARAVTVLVAASCEEVLFRGYAVPRLRALTGSPALALLIPAAAFTALHLPGWGPAHLLFVGPGAVLLTLWFQWRRDLWGNILAHFLVDAIPFLVAPLFLTA